MSRPPPEFRLADAQYHQRGAEYHQHDAEFRLYQT